MGRRIPLHGSAVGAVLAVGAALAGAEPGEVAPQETDVLLKESNAPARSSGEAEKWGALEFCNVMPNSLGPHRRAAGQRHLHLGIRGWRESVKALINCSPLGGWTR